MTPFAAPATASRALSPNVRGALWMLAASATFAGMTTLIKYLGADYPAALQAFYRQFAAFLVLTPMILRRGGALYATTRPGIVAFRASAGALAMILSFYAFQKMPLADANALSFTRTLWMVPLAAWVLHEKVGPARVGAALVGFAGVLMMIHSASRGGFAVGLPALGMLASSLLFAFSVTGMKVMTRDHAPIVILTWSATLGVLFTLLPALFVWSWPAPADLGLLALMGGLGIVNQACFIKGMVVGDAAAMAPMDYTRLLFAGLIGLVFFHEVPNAWTLAGAAVVVASTLFITWRELLAMRRGAARPLADTV